MKRMFTYNRWVYMLAFLLSSLASYTASAQRTAAKCAGFTAKIINGSVLNLCTGSSINMSADPANSGYTYQWQVQTTAGGPFESISGATRSTYTANSLGAYRVYISTGSCVDTSGITSIIHITPDGGKIAAPTTGTICQGSVAGQIKGNTVAGADVGIVTFSWERNVNNAGWTVIPDATDLNYNVGPLFKTTAYRRVASDNCGNKAYSNIVTLTTAPDVMPGTISPMSQTITAGSTPGAINSATAASGGSGNFTYQWQASLYERGTFSNIAGATSASYSPGPLTQTTYYRRAVTDVRCLNTVESAVAVVIVSNEPLNPGAFIANSSCFFPSHAPASLSTVYEPKGGVPPYTIEWQSSTDNVNFTTIPGATGSTYQPGTLTQSTYFRKKVTDAAGTVAYTGSEEITMVTTTLTGGSIKATSNVACLGSSPAEIKTTAAPTGYGEDLVYRWEYKTATTGGWKVVAGQIRESLLPDPITEQTTFRRIAVDRCGTNTREAASNEVVIDVKPALVAGDIEPTSQMIRSGQTPLPLRNVTSPSGGTGSYTLSWQSADLAVGPWDSIPSIHTPGYQPPALTQNKYYRRVVMDNNCLATQYTYTVEVFLNTAPPIVPCHLSGPTCVFPGNRPGVIFEMVDMLAGGVPPYTFSWETKPITSSTWTVIPGVTGSSYQPPVITQTTQYRIKVIDALGDFAYGDAFTVEYHTEALNPGTIGATTNTVVCGGSTPGIIKSVTNVSGYGFNPVYQWQVMYEGGSWTNIAGANKEFYQPGSITQRTHFRRAVTDECGDAKRTAYSNEVIFDLPVVVKLHAGLVNGPFITCTGSAPGTIKSVLDACGGNSALHYQWEVMKNGTWTTISGATSASYTPGAINDNTFYRRKVYDDCGNVGYSNEVEIFVYPPIEPGVIGTATQTVCINGVPEKLKLLTSCHYTDGTVSYQWQSSASSTGPWTDISGANGAEYQPAGATANTYYRLLVRSTTCSLFAYTNVVSVMVNTACRAASSRSTLTSDDIKVYPNPLTGNTIKVELQTKGKVSVRLLNAEGRAVPVTVSQISNSFINVSFSGSRAPGMYLLTVSDEKNSWTRKIIVQ
jgi:hypothetical protein